MSITCCYIKESYFLARPHYQNMLDPGNTAKQSHRAHLCVKVSSDGNDFYIPLRNNLGQDMRVFGRIGHAVPSGKRTQAGLDYRYALIVNAPSDLEYPTQQTIPNSQMQKITADYSQIVMEFENYLKGFKKAVKKRRVEREPLYRVSALVNFIGELKLQY